ncbi:MAG: TolC family protein [Planctomycetaceae bacterium]|nr:TolC family protein [Planctomycetaceae bacterium]
MRSPLPWRIIYPEQRTADVRPIGSLPYVPLPPSGPPPTVSAGDPGATKRFLTLDDAIRIALENDRVIRVLAGVTAIASGQTIYDVAIANTTVDQQLARFDPFLTVNNNWDHLELPSAVFVDPNNPVDSIIFGRTTNQYRLDAAVTKDNPLGGTWRVGVDATQAFFKPGVFPLNPELSSSADISYTQPLLQGFGRPANLAPVVLARLDTERSFFQLKGALQEQVRGVIEAYWNLVAARTAVLATELQVKQLEFNLRFADAQFRVGRRNNADPAQARTSLALFKSSLISARNNVLQSEAALRNLLGLPPWDQAELVPTTEPSPQRYLADWADLVELAAQRRPDLIELKLVLEADEQQRIIANNNALPQLDAVGLYRWNGLSGELPSGNNLSTGPGQFTDWTLGVNFSVPLGLRRERAQLRQRELILARDRANLDQGLHAASHNLATTIRSLDVAYEQYLAQREARAAAEENRKVQEGVFGSQFQESFNFLNVLLAITDLGNAIRDEAAALASYNTLLAELELQSGTILETHGIRFYEERYGSIGPLGRIAAPACYPQSHPPGPNYDRYAPGDRPAEQFFNLPQAGDFGAGPERLPPADPLPPAESLPPIPLRRPGER